MPRYGWRVELFTDFDCDDTDIILQALKNIDCDKDSLKKAEYNMWQCEKNTGLTYTSPPYRTSVAVVYKTTSFKEFINTLSHEVAHICAHVTKSFLIKLDEEEFCEMVGDLTAQTSEAILRVSRQFTKG
jgi:predicted SprT family Zn-dependent metalloprotease